MNHLPKFPPRLEVRKLYSSVRFSKIVFAGVCCFLAAQHSVRSEIINDVDFTYIYRGTAAPSNPPWTTPLANGSGTSDGTVFTIQTTAAENRYYLMAAGENSPWDAMETNGSTVEFSTRIVSQAAGATTGAVNLTITNGSRNFSFILGSDGVGINGDNHYALDTSAFHTYRLTLSGSGTTATMSVYLDGGLTPIISSYVSTAGNTANRLYFGDPSGTYGGITEWEYIAFTNQGAFAPIPEPGTVALMGMGVLGLIYRHRKLHKK